MGKHLDRLMRSPFILAVAIALVSTLLDVLTTRSRLLRGDAPWRPRQRPDDDYWPE